MKNTEEKFKEHFFNIMKNIKVGSIVRYRNIFYNAPVYIGIVEDILNCDYNYKHKTCKYCVGEIRIKKYKDNPFEETSSCIKKSCSWEIKIEEIINNFIEEDEFMV